MRMKPFVRHDVQLAPWVLTGMLPGRELTAFSCVLLFLSIHLDMLWNGPLSGATTETPREPWVKVSRIKVTLCVVPCSFLGFAS